MKRNVVRLLGLLLCALMMGGIFASCNKRETPTPEPKTEESEAGETPSKTTEHPEETTKGPEETTEKPEETNPEPIIEGPYRIDYLNNFPDGGSCTARLVLNPSWTEDFTVGIPANSPDGNLITHFNVWNNCFVGDCVPKLLLEKTYQEAIMKPLKEACERGEIEEFYVNKIDTYFQLINPLEMEKDEDKEKCIRQYPITDPNGANVPVYVFASEASVTEILWVQDLMDKYTSFSKKTIKADYAYFQDAIRKSPLSETRKAELLSEYQYLEYEHLVGLTLPDTLWSVEASNLIGFKNLIQTENGISYIGNWVVRTDNSLTSIVLRDGTVGIAYGAISNENLKSITIPASLKTICGSIVGWSSNGPFRNLYISNLAAWCAVRCTTYSYNGYNGLGIAFHVAHNLYLNGELLTDLVIPDGVTSIESSAFYRCSSLTNITIPNSVTRIERSAFDGCTGLTSVTIPNSVTNIGGLAFYGCSGLTNITIPDSMTSIGRDAFRGCTGLTSITIPDSVTSIGGRAFYYCTSLTSITIPNSVTSIDSCAFSRCTGLTRIEFNGTIGQWKAISKVSDWDSNTGSYTIHCTDGDIEKTE